MNEASRYIETMIIGAGPAGLACALELAKAKKNFVVIEREERVGGLAKTYEFKEDDLVFRTDNGPHRFFSKNPYLYQLVEDLLKEQWIKVKRQTRQYINGKFYDYPINAVQAFRNIGILKSIIMLADYVVARVRFGIFKKTIKNFEDYVVANFGRSLGQFSMINYTEKIWGVPAATIHADWAGQRIKGLNLWSAVTDALRRYFGTKSRDKPKTLIDEFYYPEYGTGLIYEKIIEKLRKDNYQVRTSIEPVRICHDEKSITTITLQTSTTEEIWTCNNLVESIPLPKFVELLSPEASDEVLQANKKLRYRSQVYLFITLNKERITTDQWIYIPDKNNPIGRLSEMKNFSEKMSPAGKTSLFVEFFCWENDAIWNMAEKDLFDYVWPFFKKMNFFSIDEVRYYYVIRQKDVYPVYDTHYKDYLGVIKKYLDNFTNLLYIGRPGRFRYNNQDHSLEMGILAARSIIENKHYDIEKVGSEEEYYESGNVPRKNPSSAQ